MVQATRGATIFTTIEVRIEGANTKTTTEDPTDSLEPTMRNLNRETKRSLKPVRWGTPKRVQHGPNTF